MRRVFAAAAFILICGPAFGAAKPPEISDVIKTDRPYGHGALTWLMLKAYDADLWTDAAQWSMEAPFALTLTYNMSFSVDDIASRSLKEMKRNNPSMSAESLAHFHQLMMGMFAPVKSGDEITGLYSPSGATRFFLNGKQTGQTTNPAFAKAFFGIWLSPTTSEPALRAKLLHLK